MNSDERSILYEIGNAQFLNVSQLLSTACLYGSFLLATSISIYYLSSSNKPQVWTICILIGFMAFTLYLTSSIEVNLKLIFHSCMNSTGQGLIAQAELADKSVKIWNEVHGLPLTIMLVLSDSIVTWRACIMWKAENRVRGALIVLMTGNFVIQVVDIVWDSLDLANSLSLSLDILSLGISLVTNALTTFFIGLKAWSGWFH
ncbi:hypothetical protein BDP27DRAFT_1365485 [Rhodocollybia butyracea]|uniref:Uncharacterized protein n=1 Tax=Rhodocollybia butyracea TaxID=206335 RepID=A0A9P5U5I3_9AGAR|nr:hypothetical protein BDP27DRAFT_1365485 [Rhodocollybia butyracea]